MTTQQQRVVVTAGASGIGLSVARSFLDAGARVFICDVDGAAVETATATNPGLEGAWADVADVGAVEVFFNRAIAAMGGVDVLVNNAGVGGPRAAVEDIAYADWDLCLRTNLSSMFYCVKQVVPVMKAGDGGVILNISTSSARTGLPQRLPYVASKVGVLGLTHNLARELGPFNIRCNSILPGLVDNARGRALVTRLAREQDISDAVAEQAFLSHISLRTWTDPADVAAMAVFLASPAARHVTGQEIAVDGNVEWEE